MTPSFPFNDKASYLAYRAQWKKDYAALSERIRNLKLCRKWTTKRDTEPWTTFVKEYPAFNTAWAQSLAAIHRRKAAQMLHDLKLAKVEAQRLYFAAKAAMAA